MSAAKSPGGRAYCGMAILFLMISVSDGSSISSILPATACARDSASRLHYIYLHRNGIASCSESGSVGVPPRRLLLMFLLRIMLLLTLMAVTMAMVPPRPKVTSRKLHLTS